MRSPLNLNDEEIENLKHIGDYDNIDIIRLWIEKARYLKKKYGKVQLGFNMQGILSTAIKVRGEALFIDFFENPDIAKKTLEVCFETTENLREYVYRYNCENGYPEIDRVQATNCAVALVSPDIYREFIMPYDLRLAQRFTSKFGIHHCGPNMDRFAELYAALPKGIYYDIGYGSDVEKCVELFKTDAFPQLIRGRLGPHILLNSDEAGIESEIKRIINSGVNKVVCVGADQNTPDRNIDAYFKSVWKHGNKQ